MNIILEKLDRGEQVSVARFNDGEVGALLGDLQTTSRGEQQVNNKLNEGLLKALMYESPSYYIGFPCPECYPVYHNFTKQKLGNYERQILATFATNHNYLNFLVQLEEVLEEKDWLLVSDKDIEFGGHHSHVNCPETNAMDSAKEILNKCLSSGEDIIVLTCGAASRYLAMKLDKVGKSALDLGSIFDPLKGKRKRNGKMIDAHIWEGYSNNTKFCPICNHAGKE